VTEFPVTAHSGPIYITAGPDGNLWFTEEYANRIGRITSKGKLTEYSLPNPSSVPYGIATGPDGNLCFTEYQGNRVGRITTKGVIREFPIPTASSGPTGIVAGPDGSIWFAEEVAHKVGRLSLDGQTFTEFPLSPGSAPNQITVGADGALWFGENPSNMLGRITTSGNLSEYALPPGGNPVDITAGPDGNLWVADQDGRRILRVTLSGVATAFSTPTGDDDPGGIAPGPDGNVWYTDVNSNPPRVSRITPTGTITDFAFGVYQRSPIGIALGPDGNLWFAELDGSAIGRVAEAQPGTSYVLVRDKVTPSNLWVKLGVTVQWTFLGPNQHSITDGTGLGLFDSGVRSFVDYFTHAFTASGIFPYHSSIPGDSMSGTVRVPLMAPGAGTTGSSFNVTWASAPPVAGTVFDVQVLGPGDSSWQAWQDAVTTTGASFAPAVSGTYQFRARMSSSSGSWGFSPVKTVRVS
jgi:virginiamycin B lyase